MKMITLVNQKRKGFIFVMTLALFLGVVCSPSYAANSSLTEDYTSEQQNRVTGTVVNLAGEPIAGAYVFQKGTDNGTSTGADGTFAINIPANSVIEVSFIGFETQEVNVGTRTSLTVMLNDDNLAVGTAVITGFGTAQSVATLTGATTSIGADMIGRSTVSLASTALMGKIAGLNFRQSSGKPGSAGGSVIRVRNMGGDPLYIIDGIESDTEKFVNLNYYDIDNVTVLKDASAALYGSKAGNGVIIVTTKRGRLGETPSVTINAQYGWSNPKPYFSTPANAEQYIKAFTNAQRMNNTAIENLTFSKEEYELWKDGSDPRYKSFDWKKAVLKTAAQVNLRASVSGGSETSNYYIGLGQIYEELHTATPKENNFNRTNLVINVDTKINKRLTVGISATGAFKTDRNVRTSNSWNSDITYASRLSVFKNLPIWNEYSIWAGYEKYGKTYPRKVSTEHTNPWTWTREYAGWNDDSRRDLQVRAFIDYKFMEGLNLRVDGGYYYNQRIQNQQWWPFYYYNYNEDTDELTGSLTGSHNRYFESRYEEIYTSKAQLNYKGSFGNHNIAAVVAAETYSKQSPNNSITTTPVSRYAHLMSTATFKSLGHGAYSKNRRAGFLGNIRYNYAEKYMVELIGRYDGASRYNPDDRWGFFPAVSGGWRISEERFWKEGGINNVMNDFKIRASWGKSGTEAGSAYQYLEGYDISQGGAFYDGAYVMGNIARNRAQFISWQWVEDIDFGIDFAMFNGRLRGTLDYFEKKTDGVVASRGDLLTPSETGWDTPSENLNSDLRRGMDGSLTWTSTIGELGYSIGANFTYARRYTWERYGKSYSSQWEMYKDHTGSPKRFYNSEWGFQTDGQFQSWEEIARHDIDIDGSGNSTLRPGDYKFKDLNGDKRIGGNNTSGTYNNGRYNYDLRAIRYARNYNNNPNLNYGINIALDWRGFDLSLNFTGAAYTGYWIHNELKFPFQNDGNVYHEFAKNQWQYDDPWAENPNLVPGKWPSMIYGARSDNNPRYFYSDIWKVSTDYIKLKNAEIGYSLPKAWLDKVNIKQARIAVTGQNLFVLSSIYRDFGVDPEMDMNSGMDYNLPRIISVGLTLKF